MSELGLAVLELVDSIGGGPFFYAGDSLGAAVGLTLAAEHPDRLLGLASFCATATFGGSEGWDARAAQVRASGTPSVVAMSATRWFAPGYLDRDPAQGSAALDRLMEVDDESYALCCEALAAYDFTAVAATVTVPTLCVVGEFDIQACFGRNLRRLALKFHRPFELEHVAKFYLRQAQPRFDCRAIRLQDPHRRTLIKHNATPVMPVRDIATGVYFEGKPWCAIDDLVALHLSPCTAPRKDPVPTFLGRFRRRRPQAAQLGKRACAATSRLRLQEIAERGTGRGPMFRDQFVAFDLALRTQ